MTRLAVLLKESTETWAEELRETSALGKIAKRGEITPAALGLYLESLRFLFYHSQRNLALGASRSAELGLEAISHYFKLKVREEQGHDGWASDDLSHLPKDMTAALRPATAIRTLVDLQRRLIAQHPICFVAYALWAEYFTVLLGDEWLNDLSRSGFDRSRVTAISKHLDADREHAARGLDEIDALWPGEPAASIILEGVAEAARVFEDFCDEIGEAARKTATVQPP